MMTRSSKHGNALTAAAAIAAGLSWLTCCGGGGDAPTPHGPGAALIVTTDYESGAYATVSLPGLEVNADLQAIHEDAICRHDPVTGLPFVVARRGADAIDVIDPEGGWGIAGEYSVGPGTNPQDIAVVSPERAYVARQGTAELLVVHPTEGTVIDTVDLSEHADGDGLPEPTWLGHHQGQVIVLLARLEKLKPADSSLLLVLDGATGAVTGEETLAATNPSGKLRYSAAVERFVIIETGAFTALDPDAPLDGGLEYFDPRTGELSGLVITEEALGGDIIDAAIVSETKGFAVIGVPGGDNGLTRLVTFDPSRGVKLATLVTSDAWDFNFLEPTPDGKEIWLADRKLTRPGIRIFDATTDEELTEAPIDTGLPPFMICFVDPSGSADLDGGTTADAGGGDGGDDPPDAGPRGDHADTVVEAPGHTGEGFGDADNAVNGVRGGGAGASGQDVFSLGYEQGVDNFVILAWSGRRVTNGPGADFAVFENPFGSSGETVFMDQLIVSLSRDGSSWVDFPHDYLAADEGVYRDDPSLWRGFAGVTPVGLHEEDNPVHPFWPEAAGGDHFDLDDLSDGDEAQKIRDEGFTFIRLVTAPSEVNPDTGEPYVKDVVSNGGDVDGIYGRYLAPR